MMKVLTLVVALMLLYSLTGCLDDEQTVEIESFLVESTTFEDTKIFTVGVYVRSLVNSREDGIKLEISIDGQTEMDIFRVEPKDARMVIKTLEVNKNNTECIITMSLYQRTTLLDKKVWEE